MGRDVAGFIACGSWLLLGTCTRLKPGGPVSWDSTGHLVLNHDSGPPGSPNANKLKCGGMPKNCPALFPRNTKSSKLLAYHGPTWIPITLSGRLFLGAWREWTRWNSVDHDNCSKSTITESPDSISRRQLMLISRPLILSRHSSSCQLPAPNHQEQRTTNAQTVSVG